MTLTAVVVDDEPLVAEHLQRKLEELWPELDILGSAVNGRQGLALIAETQPDIVFLDIHMPGMSGLQMAEDLPRDIQIVFVTAYDQYAVEAFERNAVDYLLKPVADDRLEQTITKLRTRQKPPELDLQQLLQQLKSGDTQYLQWLRTGLEEVTELVAVEDVVYFQADQKYTTVATPDRDHLIRMSIKELEKQLDPGQFWRIHRGLIVRVDQIVSARRDLRGRYTLSLRSRDEELRSSQAYGHLFKQM
ncbi:MAG: LytTR family DNA-binding domain-containing protein [Pseudomonadota bacterium]